MGRQPSTKPIPHDHFGWDGGFPRGRLRRGSVVHREDHVAVGAAFSVKFPYNSGKSQGTHVKPLKKNWCPQRDGNAVIITN